MIIKYFAWLKNITNTEEEEVNNKNITDHDRYVLNHKLDVLKEIRV